MTTRTPDNLKIYETAIRAITIADDDHSAKHKAVLALVRAGSLDFALSEYARYGLIDIRHHEDIMGLGGRLYKDLYLSHSGDAAREFARLSAEKYEEAYKDTGGYYSGINAATMSLLGGIPSEIVEMRAQRILENLPPIEKTPDTEIYFALATKAESWLLIGDIHKAQAAFRSALDYDPLNYTAHASTLKQFRMIAEAKGEAWPWLSEFVPPKAMHFAGHIYSSDGEQPDVPALSKAKEKILAADISDYIQENDIGFGYGALAAGVDILIAESLLEEGGELHVILPVSRAKFIQMSVAPFGNSWIRRFNTCLKRASTVTICEGDENWPDPMLQFRASLIAMGNAIRNSNELSVEAVQLLVWDGRKGQFGTAKDAAVWLATGRPQITIDYPEKRNAKPHAKGRSGYRFEAVLVSGSDGTPQPFAELHDAVLVALGARAKTPNLAQTIRYDLRKPDDKGLSETGPAFNALPGSITVCEMAANYLSIYHGREYRIDFVGLSADGRRVFSLRERRA